MPQLIIVICLIFLGIVVGHTESRDYTKNVARGNHVAKWQQDGRETLRRRAGRRTRAASDERLEEGPPSETEWITDTGRRTEERENQAAEDMWAVAEEYVRTELEKDERARSTMAKLDGPEFVAEHQSTAGYATSVASTEWQTVEYRDGEEILEKLRKKWKERQERRTQPLNAMELRDPAVLLLEQRRMMKTETDVRRRKRLKVERSHLPAVSVTQQQRKRENDMRRKERLKVKWLTDPTALEAHRAKTREYHKERRARLKATEPKDPEFLEDQRKKVREKSKRRREREKLACSKNPELLAAQRQQKRECNLRYEGRQKAAFLEHLEAAREKYQHQHWLELERSNRTTLFHTEFTNRESE